MYPRIPKFVPSAALSERIPLCNGRQERLQDY